MVGQAGQLGGNAAASLSTLVQARRMRRVFHSRNPFMPFSSFTPGARRLFIAVCAVSVSALLVACASPPARPTDLSSGQEAVNAYLARLIDHEMRSSSTPAMSIAIVDDQRVVWAQGFGHADVEQRIPATTRTLYRQAPSRSCSPISPRCSSWSNPSWTWTPRCRPASRSSASGNARALPVPSHLGS